jgi:ubiquinone/menaquinone biosynthesis C-methylase UbiE
MAYERDSDKELFYAMARTPEEAERLQQQSALWGEATSKVMDQLQLTPGMSCLDLGCGAGDVMLALGHRVGPCGSVLGVDTDAELGHRMVHELNKRQISNFSFVEADITDPGSLPTGTYDVTSARFLLLHLPDPIATLETMWNLTRPGGVMVVLDYDFRTHNTYPVCSELAEFITVADGMFEKTGLDPRLGVKLPYYFERACAGPPDGIEVSCFIKPVSVLRKFIALTYRSLLPGALKFGVTTEERAEKLLAFLEDADFNSPSYWLSALYCGIWKRKQ